MSIRPRAENLSMTEQKTSIVELRGGMKSYVGDARKTLSCHILTQAKPYMTESALGSSSETFSRMKFMVNEEISSF